MVRNRTHRDTATYEKKEYDRNKEKEKKSLSKNNKYKSRTL